MLQNTGSLPLDLADRTIENVFSAIHILFIIILFAV